jgi:hypothetical protein
VARIPRGVAPPAACPACGADTQQAFYEEVVSVDLFWPVAHHAYVFPWQLGSVVTVKPHRELLHLALLAAASPAPSTPDRPGHAAQSYEDPAAFH